MCCNGPIATKASVDQSQATAIPTSRPKKSKKNAKLAVDQSEPPVRTKQKIGQAAMGMPLRFLLKLFTENVDVHLSKTSWECMKLFHNNFFLHLGLTEIDKLRVPPEQMEHLYRETASLLFRHKRVLNSNKVEDAWMTEA